MDLTPINTRNIQAAAISDATSADAASVEGAVADLTVARAMAAAIDGDVAGLFDLGVFYSTGSNGVECDMIEAHKWFNLAASRGHEEAAFCRADVADEMTAREIAEAQRLARQWLADERRRAA